MITFAEFLNAQPSNLKNSLEHVEASWDDFLHELYTYLSTNEHKYDSHAAKFGNLTCEHPCQQMYKIAKNVEKGFKKMKEGLSLLGAHEMI